MPDIAQQVLITRIFDAPRARVFQAWTDPDDVAAWYGPEHFDTPREMIRIDLRVGGRYELTTVQRDNGASFLTDGPYARNAGHAEAGWNSAFDQLAARVATG